MQVPLYPWICGDDLYKKLKNEYPPLKRDYKSVFDADKMRPLWLPACLLNVRLALHPANVPIAHGRNVAASAAVQR